MRSRTKYFFDFKVNNLYCRELVEAVSSIRINYRTETREERKKRRKDEDE